MWVRTSVRYPSLSLKQSFGDLFPCCHCLVALRVSSCHSGSFYHCSPLKGRSIGSRGTVSISIFVVAAGTEPFKQWTPHVCIASWSVFGLLRLSPIRILGCTWMHEREPHGKRGIELVCICNSYVCPASCCCCLQKSSSVRQCCSTLTLVNLSASYFISILLIMHVHHCRVHSWELQTKPRFEPHTARLFASLRWHLRNRAFCIQWYVAPGNLVYQKEHSRKDEVRCTQDVVTKLTGWKAEALTVPWQWYHPCSDQLWVMS